MKPPRILSAAAGLPATFWWLFGGTAVMALATFVFPFLALFLQARGYSASETGLLVALFGAGSIPAGPLAGWLSDRLGRRPTLMGSLVIAAALTAAFPLLHSAAAVATLTLALGIAVHAYFPAANAVVADLLHPSRYDEAYGLMYWNRNIGIAVSFAIGGVLATRGFTGLFLADAATTALFAAIVYWRIPETRPAAPAVAHTGRARGWSSVLTDRHLVSLVSLNVLMLTGFFQFMVVLPVVMTRMGLSPAVYGRTLAVNGLLIALLQPISARFTARRDPGHVLAVASTLVAAGFAAYPLCSAPWQWAVATSIWSLGEILMMPTLSSVVAALSPEDLRGRYQGLFSLSFGLGLTLSPALGGLVLDRFGGNAVWLGTTALSLLVAAGHLAAGRARRATVTSPLPS